MRWALLHTLGGLCIAFWAGCADGAASPSDGSATPTGGTSATTGAAGTTGTAGAAGTGGGAGAGAALSFAADIWPVFNQTRNPPFVYRGGASYAGCTTAAPCHGGANPGARLSMTNASTAYAALVNVASTTSLCATAGGTIRVVPGNPDASCLIQFYVGRLKDDLQWVDQAEVDFVRRWIAEGARP